MADCNLGVDDAMDLMTTTTPVGGWFGDVFFFPKMTLKKNMEVGGMIRFK